MLGVELVGEEPWHREEMGELIERLISMNPQVLAPKPRVFCEVSLERRCLVLFFMTNAALQGVDLRNVPYLDTPL